MIYADPDRPITVALTGGPLGCKSTVKEYAKKLYCEKLEDGPEVASILLGGGYPAPAQNCSKADKEFWLRSFQSSVLPVQRNMEQYLLRMAANSGARLVLFDRGTIDCAAYWPWGREDFLDQFGLDLAAEFGRYDIVIHLQSVADFDPELYLKLRDTNPVRKETPDEAKRLDHLIREVWSGHPNWHFVSGQEGADLVVAQVVSVLSNYLDNEIERKWRLPKMPNIVLPEGIPVFQGYLIASNNVEMRIRSWGSQFFQTVKGERGLTRKEWERPLEAECFQALLPETWGKQIEKMRFLLPHGKHRLELDRFSRCRIPNLILLEAEFKSVLSSQQIVLPDWAEGAEEVTDNPEFYNVNLAC